MKISDQLQATFQGCFNVTGDCSYIDFIFQNGKEVNACFCFHAYTGLKNKAILGLSQLHLAGIAFGRDCLFCAMAVRSLEIARNKLKFEQKDEKKVKAEANPSPTKKLASDMEKKIKALPGDTSLVKDWFQF